MEDEVLKILINSNYTVNQLYTRLRLLHDLLTMMLFNTGEAFNPNLLSNEDKIFIDKVDKDLLAQFNPGNFEEVFRNLEAKIKAIKPLVIYTAVEIPEYEGALIGMYVRRYFKPDLILDFKLDPNLIGGTALVFNGVYKDYSVRKQIEDNKQVIIGQFKDFLGK